MPEAALLHEFKMLRSYGLHIGNEDERREGEGVVREMMEKERQATAAEGEEVSDDDSDSDIDATRLYTPAQKKWPNNGFGGERQFLARQGLDFYTIEGRKEGRRQVRALMRQDGSAEEEWMLEMGRDERDKVMDAIMYGIRPY